MKNSKSRGWQIGAALAALFLMGSAGVHARSFFYGGRPAPMYMNGGGYYGGYYAGRGGFYGGQPDMQYQAAALPPRAIPNVPSSTATDYLASVCGEGEYTWELQKMPIKVFIQDGTGTPGYKPIFQNYVRNAFNTWTAASQNKLAWLEVDDASKADITVRWTDRVTERPEGTEAGRTSAFTRLNTVTHKGIIYGARMQFLTKLPERYFADEEVEKTTLHEVGHAMGLQGHSPYRSDIMYYAVGPGNQPRLTDRDTNTLHKLYEDRPTLDDALALGKKPTTH